MNQYNAQASPGPSKASPGPSKAPVLELPPYRQRSIDNSPSTSRPRLEGETSITRASASHICTVEHTHVRPNTFVFHCIHPGCRPRRTFSRWFDFHRHYNGAHAIEKTVFWCPVPSCARSESEAHRAFPRKDKMKDHLLKIHGIGNLKA